MLENKKYLLFVILCSSLAVFAGELNDNCEPAVDAADRLGSPINKECDYSNTGLNGVLHRAVANKGKAVIDKTPNDEAIVASNNKEVTTTASVAATSIPAIESVITNLSSEKKPLVQMMIAEFSTAQQLATARYELIRNASQECALGFVLANERYFPIKNKVMKLELTYRCL